MTRHLNELLAEDATELVHRNFTGVEAEWWWERRMGGGIAVCQVLDPATLAADLSAASGRPREETSRLVSRELDLEDTEPVVLTYEISGQTTTDEVSRLLADRSATRKGLAAVPYGRLLDQATQEGA